MEFAVYGSLKSYLASLGRGVFSDRSPVNCSTNPLFSSVGPCSPHDLCCYHSLQAAVSPNLRPASHTSDPATDRAVAVHAARLMRLLQSEYYYRSQYLNTGDKVNCHHGALPYLKPVPSAVAAADTTQKLASECKHDSNSGPGGGVLPPDYSFDKLAPKGSGQLPTNYLFDHLNPKQNGSADPANSSTALLLPPDSTTEDTSSSTPVVTSLATSEAEKPSLGSSSTTKPAAATAVFPLHPPPGFNHLAPLISQSECASRPCLEDPYSHYPHWHLDYYNQEGKVGEENANPTSPASSSVPTLSPTYTNVPDVVTYPANVGVLADVYAPLTECAYCACGLQEENPSRVEGASLGRELPSNPGGQSMLTSAEIVDFSLQIARGMEHLEKMKVQLMISGI